MTRINTRRIILIAMLCLIALLTIAVNLPAQANEAPDVLDPIIEQIEASGHYRFSAQVEQTLIPRPVPANIGTTEQRIDMQLNGEVTLPDSAVLEVQFEANAETPPIRIEQVGADTYLLHNGERTQIENPLSDTTTDFVGYLHAADNIQVVANPEQPHLTTYTFEIDGHKFADYLLDKLRSQLSPDQLSTPLQLPSTVQQMSGQGELWVDKDGYTRRQIVDVFIPAAGTQFDAQIHMVIDYRYEEAVAGVPLASAENIFATTEVAADTAPTTTSAPVSQPTRDAVPTLLIGLIFSGLFLLFVVTLLRSRRWIYRAVPIGMTIVFLTTPILNPIALVQAQEDNDAARLPSIAEALGETEATDDAADETVAAPPQMDPNVPLQEQTLVDNVTCGTADVNSDLDGDALNDFVETCLGTDPYEVDTDFDGITDTLEVAGFVFTNTLGITTTFYNNPHETDSNFDGLSDFQERFSGMTTTNWHCTRHRPRWR
ncbi:MAG: hypothetical protein M9928_23355 [Anaerolineae bacterium]|nr:hypothetical protein [Anaerolineae bacterium]